MGLTNYQHALRKKYSAFTGELADARAQIARIEREQGKLPALTARIAELEALIASVAMLLKDAGGWELGQMPATKPWTHGIPIPFGSCGRRAMEIVRLADKPMTVREIALEVLKQAGIEQPERDVAQRVHNAVHAALKARRGRGLVSSGKYPAQWRCEATIGLEFDV